ncbi:MAG: acetyl-CoA carboxylase biotin carboxylase subunit [Gemmatimonadales bacterium]
MAALRRVLVANRGEIAVRIIRSCHEAGIQAVAVYSEADRSSLHVRMADQAVELGPAPAAQSYLNIEKIIRAAHTTNADSIHPGYGFLAERADFASAVAEAGLTYVGPPPAVVRAMGVKTEARQIMQAAGVPVVPGNAEPLKDWSAAVEVADDVGFPVLLKAAAGGGGKGMRLAKSPAELESEFARAASEAEKAFGDGSIYVERYVEKPRHIEIQILADQYGTVVSLGERECSIQRRHQKLIEEAPSPVVDEVLRARLAETAVRAAEAAGYVGAGTVEFLLDASGSFYFLEMNTRIQVEHPVTEMIYGVDLVREQFRVAGGERIDPGEFPGEPRGHAIECRIIAEDPENDFLPSPGTVEYLGVPTGPGVRWDGGVAEGDSVGLHYDPLIAKLIVWGQNREMAIGRMRRALDELTIAGLKTSQPFHRAVMSDPVFASGSYDTRFVDDVANEGWYQLRKIDLEVVAVAAALAEDSTLPTRALQAPAADGESPWVRTGRREALRS